MQSPACLLLRRLEGQVPEYLAEEIIYRQSANRQEIPRVRRAVIHSRPSTGNERRSSQSRLQKGSDIPCDEGIAAAGRRATRGLLLHAIARREFPAKEREAVFVVAHFMGAAGCWDDRCLQRLALRGGSPPALRRNPRNNPARAYGNDEAGMAGARGRSHLFRLAQSPRGSRRPEALVES